MTAIAPSCHAGTRGECIISGVVGLSYMTVFRVDSPGFVSTRQGDYGRFFMLKSLQGHQGDNHYRGPTRLPLSDGNASPRADGAMF